MLSFLDSKQDLDKEKKSKKPHHVAQCYKIPGEISLFFSLAVHH